MIRADTRVFLRDGYDHSVQIIDSVETLRDVVSRAIDLHRSNDSNRANEVMKVLTIMASIFIPITFLVGLQEMTSDDMPELTVRRAYAALWLMLIAVAPGLIVFFPREGWS